MDSLTKQDLISHLLEKEELINKQSLTLPLSGGALSSHKVLLEGIDFNLTYTPLKHLGYKSILALLGPLYAQGVPPTTLSIVIALSSRFKVKEIEELWSGMSVAIKEHKIDSVVLDLIPSLTGLTISLSSQGEQKRTLFVQPQECKENHLLAISGTLGAAYLGVQILERERRIFEEAGADITPKLDSYTYVLRHYLNPHIDLTLFELLKEEKIVPSSADFISQGLAHSVKTVATREKLGARVYMNRIPFNAEASKVAEELSIDPMTAVLNGGDDFQFLFAFPLEDHEKILRDFPQLEVIGHLSSQESGMKLVTPDGQELPLKAQAWDK